MKIAYFTETFLPNTDDIVVKIQHLLDYMAGQDHQIFLYAPNYNGLPVRYGNTRVISVPGRVLPLFPQLKTVYPWTRVENELHFVMPDLIHLINPAAMGMAGLRAAKSFNIPVVASYHTDVPDFAPRWHMRYFRAIHKRCDLNFASSIEAIGRLEERGFERLQVWRSGVDIEHFAPHKRSNEMRMRLTDGEPKKPLLLFVDRLATEMRSEMLLDVIKSLPNARLAIVGDGPNREKMERLFAGTPTVFTGILQGNELAQAYASGDIFLFVEANETWANVALEAMASGLPIVAPNSGSLDNLVHHEETGLLYETDATVSFIETVRTLLDDEAMAWRFGLRGRAVAEERSWPHVLDDLVAEYRHVLNGDYGVKSGVDTVPLEDLDEDDTDSVLPAQEEAAVDEPGDETETGIEAEALASVIFAEANGAPREDENSPEE